MRQLPKLTHPMIPHHQATHGQVLRAEKHMVLEPNPERMRQLRTQQPNVSSNPILGHEHVASRVSSCYAVMPR